MRVFDDLSVERPGEFRSFGDYGTLGEKHFPREFFRVRHNKPVVEFHTDVLETFAPDQSGVFTPTADAESKRWCSDMNGAVAIEFGGAPPSMSGVPSAPTLNLPFGFGRPLALFFEVDETGHTRDVKAFKHGGPILLKEKARRELMKSVFRPATCHDIPVQTEMHILYP